MPQSELNPTHRLSAALPCRVAAVLAILACLATLTACDISEPSLPSFDSSVSIPLGSQRLTIAEVLDDDPSLVTAEDGGISFTTAGEPDTISLGMDLDVDVAAQHIHQSWGSFVLDDPDPVAVGESFAEAWPPASQAAGTTTTVPDFDFRYEAPGLGLGGITACTLSQGTLTLTAESTWPVVIRGPEPGMPVEASLLAADSDEVLLAIPVGPIPAGGQVSTTVPLAGLALPGDFRLVLAGHGDGSEAPVPIDGDEALNITLVLADLAATTATARVPAQAVDLEFRTDLGSGDQITAAEIGTGLLTFGLHNETPLAMGIDLLWDQIITGDGRPLTASANLPAGADTTIAVSFAGCRILESGPYLDSLTAQVTARTPGSGNQTVTLSSTQGLTADLDPGVLSFTTVSGCFAPDSWDLEPTTAQISYPDDSDGMEFTTAVLSILLDNTADLGATLDMTITGTGGRGDEVSLQVHDFIDPANADAGKTTLRLDESNSDIVTFLNARPRTITMAGTVSLTPGEACGTVSADDRLAVGWALEVPLRVNLDHAALDGDITPLGLDDGLREVIDERAGPARFQGEVSNHIPAALELTILAADDPADLPDHPGLRVGPVTVAAAATDPVTGMVTDAVLSRPVIELTAEQARYFGRPGLHTMYQAILSSDPESPVRIISTDYLTVTGMVTAELRVDGEF